MMIKFLLLVKLPTPAGALFCIINYIEIKNYTAIPCPYLKSFRQQTEDLFT